MTYTPTAQQQEIIAHNHGPALVFAVAGSGKTTAMVHRIARLVQDNVFDANRILATTFNRAAKEDISNKLGEFPGCTRVNVSTLHGLGFLIIRTAVGDHLTNPVTVQEPHNIYYETLRVAWRRDLPYKKELDTIDRDDFLDFVGACKGNLQFADLARAGLLVSPSNKATQAVPPITLPWYLDLYRLFEEVRMSKDWITYDDMLLSGWALLFKHPALLARLSNLYQCVLVDEYQDINLAQSEILDLITQPHGNYMAIGDDDQTIYEWRGAKTDFILAFKKRYQARVYEMTANFRCPAPQIALANNVIHHNRRRHPKRLEGTVERVGHAFLHVEADEETLGRSVVMEIKSALVQGLLPKEIVVLVRLYSQTPYIEQFLIAENIPYWVSGSVPFYERAEVVTLISYLRLGILEQALRGGQPLTNEQVAQLSKAWNDVYNKPKRYISKVFSETIRDKVVYQNATLSRTLALMSADATHAGIGRSMEELASLLEWLALNLALPADQLLRELDRRLEYRQYLCDNSGFPETGEQRAANIAAFIRYATGKGNALQFLSHLEKISFGRLGRPEDTSNAIEITTTFRAKGREWQKVIVPHCNQGTLPFVRSGNIEEERRLFYVAVTRSKESLHLYRLRNTKISQFLEEGDYERVLGSYGMHTLPRAAAPVKAAPRPAVPTPVSVTPARARGALPPAPSQPAKTGGFFGWLRRMFGGE